MNTGTIIGIVGGSILSVILLSGVYNVSKTKTNYASPVKTSPVKPPPIKNLFTEHGIKPSDGSFYDIPIGGKRKTKRKKI